MATLTPKQRRRRWTFAIGGFVALSLVNARNLRPPSSNYSIGYFSGWLLGALLLGGVGGFLIARSMEKGEHQRTADPPASPLADPAGEGAAHDPPPTGSDP